MRKMNHELHSGDDALQTSKKNPRIYPRRGKIHLGADQKKPAHLSPAEVPRIL